MKFLHSCVAALFSLSGVTATALSAAYTRPATRSDAPGIVVYHEAAHPLDSRILAQLRATSEEFLSLQESSPAAKLTANPQALAVASEIIRTSLDPLTPKENESVQARLSNAISKKRGAGLGYGGMAFPEVHVWTKSSLRKIFESGDHPPGLSLDPKTQMLDQVFVAPDGALNPIPLIIDDSVSGDDQVAASSEFLRYWSDSLRRTQDTVAAVLIFSAVREVSLEYLNDGTHVPDWFKLGTANLIAYNDCAALLGEGAAEHALNLCVGPQSLKNPAEALKADLAEGSGNKPAERSSFELCRTAQINTSKTFIRLVLSAVAKAKDRAQSDKQIVDLYRSAAGVNKSLFGAS